MKNLLLLLLAIPTLASAADFGMRIRGDVFNWTSTVPGTLSNTLASAKYQNMHGLPVAEAFIPGTIQGAGNSINVAVSNGAQSINLPITYMGVEYVLGQTPQNVEAITGATTTLEGNHLSLIGTTLGNKKVTFANPVSPFTQLRPIMSGFDTDIYVNAFKNAKLPKGVYRGTHKSTLHYEYYRNGVRIRQALPIAFGIEVNYNPAILNSVTIVSGNGVIEPRYYGYPEKLVGGETNYQLQVNGDFQSGLKMGLRSSKHLDGLFALRPVDAMTHSTDTKITYNVRCTNGCDGNGEIINEGQAMIDDSNNRIDILPIDPTQSATVGININFGNKPLADIPNGLYQDSFVLIFETLL